MAGIFDSHVWSKVINVWLWWPLTRSAVASWLASWATHLFSVSTLVIRLFMFFLIMGGAWVWLISPHIVLQWYYTAKIIIALRVYTICSLHKRDDHYHNCSKLACGHLLAFVATLKSLLFSVLHCKACWMCYCSCFPDNFFLLSVWQ